MNTANLAYGENLRRDQRQSKVTREISEARLANFNWQQSNAAELMRLYFGQRPGGPLKQASLNTVGEMLNLDCGERLVSREDKRKKGVILRTFDDNVYQLADLLSRMQIVGTDGVIDPLPLEQSYQLLGGFLTE